MLQNDLKKWKDEVNDRRKKIGDLDQSVSDYKRKLQVEERKVKEFQV
jgi:hypothetical protein